MAEAIPATSGSVMPFADSDEIDLASPRLMEPAEVTMQKQKETESMERWGRCIIVTAVLVVFSLGLVAGGVAHKEYERRTTRPPSNAEFVALGGVVASLNASTSACTDFETYAGHQLPTGYTLHDTVVTGPAATFVEGYWGYPRGHTAYVDLISPSTALREGLVVNRIHLSKSSSGHITIGLSGNRSTATVALACGECSGARNETPPTATPGMSLECYVYIRQLIRDAERCSCCDTGRACSTRLPSATVNDPEQTCRLVPIQAATATQAANDRAVELIYHTKLMTHSQAVDTAIRAWPTMYEEPRHGDKEDFDEAVECFRSVENITINSRWSSDGLPGISAHATTDAKTFDDMVVSVDAEYHSAKFDNPRTPHSWPITPVADHAVFEHRVHFLPSTFQWAFGNLRAYGLGRTVGALAKSAAQESLGPCPDAASAAAYYVDRYQKECKRIMSAADDSTPQKWMSTLSSTGTNLNSRQLFYLGASREIGADTVVRSDAFGSAFNCKKETKQDSVCLTSP
jgi:hypothetical protein